MAKFRIVLTTGHAPFAKGAYNEKFDISEYDITRLMVDNIKIKTKKKKRKNLPLARKKAKKKTAKTLKKKKIKNK